MKAARQELSPAELFFSYRCLNTRNHFSTWRGLLQKASPRFYQRQNQRLPMQSLQKTTPSINVTPLIDILLVLLIIFMVISPARPHRFATQAPDRDSSVEKVALPAVIVSITETRELKLDNRKVSATQMASELTAMMNARAAEDRNVFISGAPTLDYQSVVKVIDIVRASGAQRQGLTLN
jgi:biopolymer transport protein ExbD